MEVHSVYGRSCVAALRARLISDQSPLPGLSEPSFTRIVAGSIQQGISLPLGPVCQQRVACVVRRRRQIVSESVAQWVGDAVTRTLSGINEVWRARHDGNRPTPDGDKIVPLVIPYRNRELSPVQKVAAGPVPDHTATACMR